MTVTETERQAGQAGVSPAGRATFPTTTDRQAGPEFAMWAGRQASPLSQASSSSPHLDSDSGQAVVFAL